ncbi:MCE family protein [Tomitella fengzijianii]|uniref:MCE family protein n=1 Tax=Tomitella fengzijianii TaxID=2597660 RepID=A0A516X0L7_9ACTN|nr:MCE family protein [Tomitella fengzijianii]QDQ96608.1 MCE family protein [Tomitella fengzijianii]
MNGFGAPRGHVHAARGQGRPAPRRLTASKGALALRGAAAVIAIVVGAAAFVAYGNGVFAGHPEITADLPAEAGLLTGSVGVQYQGVPVGEVTAIDAGTDVSTVHLRIDPDALGRIPAAVKVRVAPNTLFGDVVLQLVPDPARSAPGGRLQAGDALPADTSPAAVRLYDVYEHAVATMDRLQPQHLQTALTAMADALRGRGDDLGRSLDRLSRSAGTLVPDTRSLLARAPQFAAVTESADAAAADGLGVLRDITSLSKAVTDRPDSLAAFFRSAGAAASSAAAVAGENTGALRRIVDQAAPALTAVDAGRRGLPDTFEALRRFTDKGVAAFDTGVFDITAVPSFSDPMPYPAADCPRYGGLAGANCGGGGD